MFVIITYFDSQYFFAKTEHDAINIALKILQDQLYDQVRSYGSEVYIQDYIDLANKLINDINNNYDFKISYPLFKSYNIYISKLDKFTYVNRAVDEKLMNAVHCYNKKQVFK